MAGIFISYRREDGGPYAGRLYDALVTHLDRDTVFFDIDSIGPGEDFRDVLQRTLSSCKVVLAVIGTRWSTVQDKAGRTRITNDLDYVRMEISYALKNGLKVIPVLVGGAAIPEEAELPPDLHALRYRNAWDLSDRRFHQDVQILVDVIRKALSSSGSDTPAPDTPMPATPSPAPVFRAPAPTKTPAAERATDGPSLFPLYGITLGKTTVQELAKLGERTSNVDETTGEPYLCYEVNEIDFWYDEDSEIVDHMYLVVGGTLPAEWEQLGLKWENSYNQWLSWLKSMNYTVEIEEPPHVEEWESEDTFSAKVKGRKTGRLNQSIELDFAFEKGTIDSPSTIYSISLSSDD